VEFMEQPAPRHLDGGLQPNGDFDDLSMALPEDHLVLPPRDGRDRRVPHATRLSARPSSLARSHDRDTAVTGGRILMPTMSNNYIIEVGSGAAGIVVWDGFGYRFYAATHRFNPLDGRTFCSPGEAELAAVRHYAQQRADFPPLPTAPAAARERSEAVR
jgi:hypothetical protein